MATGDRFHRDPSCGIHVGEMMARAVRSARERAGHPGGLVVVYATTRGHGMGDGDNPVPTPFTELAVTVIRVDP